MSTQKEQFNLILAGVGGQGLITLLKILGEASLVEEKEFRSSELHGLSQRGGSVGIHVRLGQEIHSPLISPEEADLVVALEFQEALSALKYASKETSFLVNEQETPTMSEGASQKEVEKNIKKVSSNLEFISASNICEEELGNSIVAGIFLLGYASQKGFFPLDSESILKGIEKTIPEKYLDLNKKAFELGENKSQ